MARYEVTLPAAPPLRAAPLVARAPTGDEELRALGTPGLQRALTALIAGCVHAEGTTHPLGADAARALPSSERTRLGFAMGIASDGPRFRRTIRCAASRCRAEVTLDVDLAALPERPPAPGSGTVRCAVPIDRERPLEGYATFRLPDGADQEAVEATSADWRETGLTGGPVLVRLLDRLLIGVNGRLPGETALWSEEDRQGAWNAIRGALGGPDTEVDLVCGVCGTRFVHRVSPLGWLRTDPREAESRLRAEVGALRERHGWTEQQALWLPRPKRRALARSLRSG